MHALVDIKKYREDKNGTDLMIYVPDMQLTWKISELRGSREWGYLSGPAQRAAGRPGLLPGLQMS